MSLALNMITNALGTAIMSYSGFNLMPYNFR